ncbi:hypothetical protein EDWATA_02544 [Edwardsiella tarda ATCC 23685]|uniref:Uncharacterized protein n=1 Tax=Edwardsiella tarda ATCC 23685 TaxID=500638 RepID=D4F710_EDWTA|nr:hypothetical protein EDWATA_02544 [Edwardsiella tarda ATCC 23685]
MVLCLHREIFREKTSCSIVSFMRKWCWPVKQTRFMYDMRIMLLLF